MERFERGKIIACACFLVAYFAAFVVVGSYDNACDAVLAANDIARHDAEWMMSASFELFAVVGLISLWPFDIGSWYGGIIVGLLSAFAAGGLHMMPHVVAWLPLALFAGFASGYAFLVLGGRRAGACTLLAVETALAVFQIAFLHQSL